MIRFQTIIPVSLFKKNSKEYLSRLEHDFGPLLLTVHGRGAFVIEHINAYMRISELADEAAHHAAFSEMLRRGSEVGE